MSKKIILGLIEQNRKLDKEAKNTRKKMDENFKMQLLHTWIALFVLTVGTAYFLRDIRVAYALIPLVLLFLAYFIYRSKVKNKRIYKYTYSKSFPFKAYYHPYTHSMNDKFIHGKIYVIDNKIAYVGSLNFTKGGTKYNYETRVQTTSKKAVDKITNEVEQLFYSSGLLEVDIQKWGSLLHTEPKN